MKSDLIANVGSATVRPAAISCIGRTVYSISIFILSVFNIGAALPAVAQDLNNSPSLSSLVAQAQTNDVVIVEGRRQRGLGLSEIQPELTLTESDIAAYGVSSIGELLEQLEAETSSGRGRGDQPPVVLLNGRRISGFREIGRYPAEALARVDVLPEEASLAYGFSADQRVINFILKPNVTVTALEGAIDGPQEGGSNAGEGSVQHLFVDGDTRFSIDGRGRIRPPILESERDIAFIGDTDETSFRTLASDRTEWEAGFSAGRAIWGDATATLSGAFERAVDDDRLGLDVLTGNEPLVQRRRVDDANIGLSLVSKLAPTTWNVTAQYNLIDTDTETQFNLPEALETQTRLTSSRRDIINTDFVINSKLAQLPAGPLAVTGQIGYQRETLTVDIDDFDSSIANDTSRDTVSSRFSLDIPVFAPWVLPGDMTFNGNAQIEELSDFGLLRTFGYGLTWRPTTSFRIIASATHEEGAPILDAVGGPTLITPGVRVFDFATGEDSFVEVVDGANANLVTDDRRVFKVGLQFKPFEETDLTLNADYTSSRIDNETRTFFSLTEEFEAAFPDRVTRDTNGALIGFDRRPVVVAETRRDELRSGFNLTKRLRSRRTSSRNGPPESRGGQSSGDDQSANGAQSSQSGKTESGNAPSKRRRSGRPGQLRLSAYHRWNLRDEVLIAEGVTPFDFLNGSAIGRFGGSPAHNVDVSLYRWNKGLGVFLGANYQTGTDVSASDGDLFFSDLFVADFRLTFEFNYSDRILGWAPFLEETRLAIGVDNILDDKIQVTDASGNTPLTFQEDIIDPFGRVFQFELRRRF